MHRFVLLLVAFLIPISLHAQDVSKPVPVSEVKASFLKLLDRPKVPLDVKVTTTKNLPDGTVLEHLTFASEKKADGSIERVPTLILRPEKAAGKLGAVIVLHGTGGSKDGQVAYMKEVVKRNLIAVAIDARYHGERSKKMSYNQAITNAWLTKKGEPMEHPFYYDTVWDLWRLADYLEARPDVDAKKLGMIGFSMGGIQTYLAASVDDRILVSVPAIGIQSFRWSLENEQWQGRANTIKQAHLQAAKDLGEPAVNRKVCEALWNKIIPGILDPYDCPSMLRLFAGRPLLIVSGTMDKNCPYGGAKIAIASVERAYKEANCSDKLRVMVEEVGHTVTPTQRAASLDWFEKWLK